MAKNPYMTSEPPAPPRKAYTLTVVGHPTPIRVDPEQLPDEQGQEGSLLSIMMHAGVDIEHVCGGVCACSTCHVYVTRGLSTANEATDDELDMLDTAPALQMNSRLACQCVPSGDSDVTVEVPSWNRNAVKEGH